MSWNIFRDIVLFAVFQEMLQKTREDKTGEALEVNERILDSCTGLMKVSLPLCVSSDILKFRMFFQQFVNVLDVIGYLLNSSLRKIVIYSWSE